MSIKQAINNLVNANYDLASELANTILMKLIKMSKMKRHTNKTIEFISNNGAWILYIDNVAYVDDDRLPLKVISDIMNPILTNYGWKCIPTGTIKCLNGNVLVMDFY